LGASENMLLERSTPSAVLAQTDFIEQPETRPCDVVQSMDRWPSSPTFAAWFTGWFGEMDAPELYKKAERIDFTMGCFPFLFGKSGLSGGPSSCRVIDFIMRLTVY
jgi:hypothetical protein